MKTIERRLFAIGLGLALAATSTAASAADGDKPFAKGFDVAPSVKRAFAEQRSKAVRPSRLVPTVEVKANLHVVAQLARFADGVALLATPVTPKRAEVLMRIGAREVETEASAKSHTVYNGHYYRAYGAYDLDPVLFEKLVGEKVRVDLVRTSDGRIRITQIRRAT